MGWFGDAIGAIGGAMTGNWGDVISGGLNLIGGERANSANLASAREVMENNNEQAAIDREFQADQAGINREYMSGEAKANRGFQNTQARIGRRYATKMSNTAHQREMADLTKAGLNPILGFAKGGGSSTPSPSVPHGAQGSGSAASGSRASAGGMARLENTLGGGVSSALASMTARASAKHAEASADTQTETKNLVRQQGKNAIDEGDNIRAEKVIKDATAEEIRARTKDLYASTAERRAREEQSRMEALLTYEKYLSEPKNRARTEGETLYTSTAERQKRAHLVGDELEANINASQYGRAMRYGERALPFINSAGSLMTINNLFKALKPRFKSNRNKNESKDWKLNDKEIDSIGNPFPELFQ